MTDYKSTLTDSHILQHTVRSDPDEKGRVRLQFRYDDDHVLTSEQIVDTEIKGGVLIAWCNAVRETEEQRMQQEEVARHTPEVVEEKTRSTLPDDPVDMIAVKCADLQSYVENLEATIRGVTDDLERARENLKKWEGVRDALGNTDGVDFDDMPSG